MGPARWPSILHAHSETSPTLQRLAEAYGYALARGHTVDVFLRINGLELTADEVDAVDAIQSLAAGDLTEDQLGDWIAANSATLA